MSQVKEIDVHSLKHKLDNKEDFILLDVRENKELEICKIEQALHIPMGVIPAHLNEIDFDKPIIIMCKSGGRSAQVCHYLNERGYSNIYNLRGGITSWALEIDSQMNTY
tara:strand:+ start:193 stop:519 length:327 start_codon:yes stop_codon:yes gene_type:complete